MKRHVNFEQSSVHDFDYIWQYFGLSQPIDFQKSENEVLRLSAFDGMSVRFLEKDSDDQELTIQIDDISLQSDEVFKRYFKDRLRQYLEVLPIHEFPVDKHCFYCGKRLKYRKVGEHIDIRSYVNSEDFDPLNMSLGTLEWCINCNYWNWIHFEQTWLGRAQLTGYLYTNMVGKLREFDMELPQGCIEEVGAWIRRKPSTQSS